MEFSRQEYWSALPFPSPGDLPEPGTEPGSPASQADSLPSEPPGKPLCLHSSLVQVGASMGWQPCGGGCSVWIWDVHILKVEGADLYKSHFSGTVGDKNPAPSRLEIPNGNYNCSIGTRADKEASGSEWESRNNPTLADRLTHLTYVTVWHCRQWGKGRQFQYGAGTIGNPFG